ncbi:MAG: non-canonical purine NTP pyrophosphatase [Acidobacteria bacterium]|nr:non-canonical purine NTP pyrophosphatase [Acidobacteriota bacterium]
MGQRSGAYPAHSFHKLDYRPVTTVVVATSNPDKLREIKFALIYRALSDKRALDSPARFVCALALAKDDRILFEARGTVEGRIAPAPAGEGGFGYDPIFFYPPFGRTLAEIGDRKSEVSHRGKAFRQLKRFLAGLESLKAEV